MKREVFKVYGLLFTFKVAHTKVNCKYKTVNTQKKPHPKKDEDINSGYSLNKPGFT